MKQYQDALREILENGVKHEDRTGVGTISYFGGGRMIFDLTKGFPIQTTKRVPFRWVAEELFWFLSGSTSNFDLRDDRGVDIWDEWATLEQTARFGREEGDLGPVYGYLWRSFGGNYPQMNGVDQIARLIKDLKENPGSRRHLVTGWDPQTADTVALPPCHTLFQFKVDSVNGEQLLSCQLYQRSADFFLGVPFNITSYSLLLTLVAHVVGMKPWKFIHTFGDAHIYSNHFDQVNEVLSRTPGELPKLELINADSLTGLDGLLNFKYDNLNLVGYEPQGKISAPVAV